VFIYIVLFVVFSVFRTPALVKAQSFLGVIGAGVPPLLGALTSFAYWGALYVFLFSAFRFPFSALFVVKPLLCPLYLVERVGVGGALHLLALLALDNYRLVVGDCDAAVGYLIESSENLHTTLE